MAQKRNKRRAITVEEDLEQLHALSSATEEEATSVLRRALRERSALVAERAAKIARERAISGLEADLVHAFERFLQDPVKRDPGCRAKLAALEALDLLDGHAPTTFLTAACYVQLEPQ